MLANAQQAPGRDGILFAAVRPDAEGAEVTVATGGHPPPFVLRGDGTVESVHARGTLLGVVAEPTIGQDGVRLRGGDAVVLYTDGLTERGGVEPDEIASELKRLTGLTAEEIAQATESLAVSEGLRDDLAILVLRASPATR